MEFSIDVRGQWKFETTRTEFLSSNLEFYMVVESEARAYDDFVTVNTYERRPSMTWYDRHMNLNSK